MKYEIQGGNFPVLICTLEQGEQMITEGGAMSWMSPNMDMKTTSNGGIGKIVSRLITAESLFQNIYTAVNGQGMISFASSFPGEIVALDVSAGKEYILQKSAFLASTNGVKLSAHINKKIGAGLFGGEGFVMQKVSGNGIAFIEIDGASVNYDLEAGQQIIIDTGHLVMCSSTCSIDVKTVKGAKNILLGGESLFNTVVTGPGEVVVQTMPIYKVAHAIQPFIVTNTKS